MAKATEKSSMPIRAWIILFWAEDNFSLSPPEVNHSKAPHTIIKINTIVAMEKIKITSRDKKSLMAPAPLGSLLKNPARGAGALILPKILPTTDS